MTTMNIWRKTARLAIYRIKIFEKRQLKANALTTRIIFDMTQSRITTYALKASRWNCIEFAGKITDTGNFIIRFIKARDA